MSMIFMIILGSFLMGLMFYSFYIVLFSRDSKKPAEKPESKKTTPKSKSKKARMA